MHLFLLKNLFFCEIFKNERRTDICKYNDFITSRDGGRGVGQVDHSNFFPYLATLMTRILVNVQLEILVQVEKATPDLVDGVMVLVPLVQEMHVVPVCQWCLHLNYLP